MRGAHWGYSLDPDYVIAVPWLQKHYKSVYKGWIRSVKYEWCPDMRRLRRYIRFKDPSVLAMLDLHLSVSKG